MGADRRSGRAPELLGSGLARSRQATYLGVRCVVVELQRPDGFDLTTSALDAEGRRDAHLFHHVHS